MSGYIGSTPVPQATQHRESFTCTEGQTTFNTAGYTAQFVDVYLNGSHLSPADFTATNGSDVVLGVAASADDVCDIISYTPFEVAGATFTGTTTTDVSLTTGVLTANGGAVFNEGSADVDFRVETNGNANMLFVDGGNNRLQIGSATTDDDQMFQLILAGGSAGFGIHSNRAAAGGSSLIMSHNRNNAVGSFTILQDNDTLGRITFQGCDGGDIKTEGAQIAAEVDGTPGTNDMPTRLVFSTTADGSNSIAEAMRISRGGDLLLGTTTTNIGTEGTVLYGSGNEGVAQLSSTNMAALYVNRSNGGTIVDIRVGGTSEGTISASGSDISYNAFSGSHWSRLTDNSQPTILKGTLIETIDEMCDWYQAQFTVLEVTDADGNVTQKQFVAKKDIALPDGALVGDKITQTSEGITYDDAVIIKEADNKHTKCKISNTADSTRIYGVFAAWDHDDDNVNDMYVTAVGTHVVRVHGGQTVSAGDLLVSNGDGTAKVQDDDIIRSKTLGKVLTNIKQETYADDSYTVPCALYCG